jgi:uncharacterized protein YjiK
MKGRLVIMALAALAMFAGCTRSDGNAAGRPKASEIVDARLARLNSALASPDSNRADNDPVARWLLPKELAEISGLALTPDGRLFTHNDEMARITEIDYRRGTVTKHFFAGEPGMHGDFEGLTYANDHFYMLSSNGVIYEFPEGQNGERVDCTVHDTHLGKECEFEGITYDAKSNSMILACKNVGEQNRKGNVILYRVQLDAGGEGISEIVIPQSKLIGRNSWKELRPTDITVDPKSGNYVLISAQEKAIFAVSPEGEAVTAAPLNGDHPQAEGVAITRDRILIVSDEASNAAATITLYRWQ